MWIIDNRRITMLSEKLFAVSMKQRDEYATSQQASGEYSSTVSINRNSRPYWFDAYIPIGDYISDVVYVRIDVVNYIAPITLYYIYIICYKMDYC